MNTRTQLGTTAVVILEQDGIFGIRIQRRGHGASWSATYWAEPQLPSPHPPRVVCPDVWEHLETLQNLDILAAGQRTVAYLGYTVHAAEHRCTITTQAASAASTGCERSAHGGNTVDPTAIPEFHARLARLGQVVLDVIAHVPPEWLLSLPAGGEVVFAELARSLDRRLDQWLYGPTTELMDVRAALLDLEALADELPEPLAVQQHAAVAALRQWCGDA